MFLVPIEPLVSTVPRQTSSPVFNHGPRVCRERSTSSSRSTSTDARPDIDLARSNQRSRERVAIYARRLQPSLKNRSDAMQFRNPCRLLEVHRACNVISTRIPTRFLNSISARLKQIGCGYVTTVYTVEYLGSAICLR